ncbi:MAG: hypothetical protein HYT07_03880 [Candidatus Levybacteria bacterium]|nr:hypothetical protein [Candidatus Levybacteria bacterium]
MKENPKYQALKELVDPTKRVVKIAMEKVREGKVDDLGRQSVILKSKDTHKLFEIIDTHVNQKSGDVISVGLLNMGLFVYEFLRGENESLTNGIGIQIPRSVDYVNLLSISFLRGLDSTQIDLLAEELSSATVV